MIRDDVFCILYFILYSIFCVLGPTWWYSRKATEPPAEMVLNAPNMSSERLISLEA